MGKSMAEKQPLLGGPPEAIRAEIQNAVAHIGGRRLLIGPGTAPNLATLLEHFNAARQAVDA
jgi:hypothetical protein